MGYISFRHILLLELNILNLQYLATMAGWLRKNDFKSEGGQD